MGNTPVIVKIFVQTLVENSTYISEFIRYKYIIKNTLRTQEMLCYLGYKLNKLLRILFDNKEVVLLTWGINIVIKKRSIALAFHGTRKEIVAGTIKL